VRSAALFLAEHFYHNVWCDEFASRALVVFARMVFCPIVGIVEFARSPIDAELFLAFAVAEPMESHVHGFGAFGYNFAVDDSVCHRVVGLERSCWLWVAHFFQNYSNVDGLSCHDV